MTPKDKPKRPGAKPLSRDIRSKAGPKADGEKPAKPAVARAVAAETEGEAKAERISKVMARAGVASRRDIERMIMEGRVTLNGRVLETPSSTSRSPIASKSTACRSAASSAPGCGSIISLPAW